MRNFLGTALALVLGFLGAIVPIWLPGGFFAKSDGGMGRATDLTFLALSDTNAVEVEGVRFETIVPERVLNIPANQPDVKTPIKLALHITNKTQKSIRFTRFDPQINVGLDLVELDGLALKGQVSRGLLLGTPPPCPLIQPGESFTFFIPANLYWQNNVLQLGGSEGLGGGWNFHGLNPGIYHVRFKYGNSSSVAYCYNPDMKNREPTAPKKLEGLWTGQVATPFVEFRLVQP